MNMLLSKYLLCRCSWNIIYNIFSAKILVVGVYTTFPSEFFLGLGAQVFCYHNFVYYVVVCLECTKLSVNIILVWVFFIVIIRFRTARLCTTKSELNVIGVSIHLLDSAIFIFTSAKSIPSLTRSRSCPSKKAPKMTLTTRKSISSRNLSLGIHLHCHCDFHVRFVQLKPWHIEHLQPKETMVTPSVNTVREKQNFCFLHNGKH